MAGGKQQMVGGRTIRRVGGFLVVVAAGVGLLYLRDPHSLLVPTLYTEDGVWMARLFNAGFWHTLIHAKGGQTPYFVSLNILLLQAAKSLNTLWFGDSLVHLPRFVSVLAMTFYATLATTCVALLNRWLTVTTRALLWGLVIFMPLGSSSFEILGRVSNIGYGMLCLCVCILVWRRTADRGRPWRIASADAGVFLCATTNPLCYPVIAVDYACRAWRLWQAGADPRAVVRGSFAARSAAVLGAALMASVVGMALLEGRPGPFLHEDARTNELVEAIVARPLLFPVVFPWYGRLHDSVAVAAVAGLAGLAWWLTAETRRERAIVVATAAVSVYAAAATVVVRPGLTLVLDHYRTSMLDRYYYGTSLLVVVAVCVAASAGLRAGNAARRSVAAGVVASIVAIYAMNGGDLVEFRRSRWHDPPHQPFASAITSAAASAPEGAERVRVELHPRPWKARFPAANVRATVIAVVPGRLRR